MENKYIKYKTKYLELKKNISKNSLFLSGGGNNKSDIILIKAEWCGHCKNFLPQWQNLQKSELKNEINFVTLDSEKHKTEIEKYNIQGYPSIFKKNGNVITQYENSVGNIDELIKFMKNN